MVDQPGQRPEPVESIEELASQIAARLRRVCGEMSDQEFSALVMDIARMKLRFSEIDRDHFSTNGIDRLSEAGTTRRPTEEPPSDA